MPGMVLVLDTNIWLDWLVFDDPGIASIKAAVAAGRAGIFIDAACRQELEHVLARPISKKAMSLDTQAAQLEECRLISRMFEPTPLAEPAARLPVCRDPDDQKFLELARDCRADFLITKDRALLVLARRKVAPAPFCIVTPQQFADAPDAT